MTSQEAVSEGVVFKRLNCEENERKLAKLVVTHDYYPELHRRRDVMDVSVMKRDDVIMKVMSLACRRTEPTQIY